MKHSMTDNGERSRSEERNRRIPAQSFPVSDIPTKIVTTFQFFEKKFSQIFFQIPMSECQTT